MAPALMAYYTRLFSTPSIVDSLGLAFGHVSLFVWLLYFRRLLLPNQSALHRVLIEKTPIALQAWHTERLILSNKHFQVGASLCVWL